MCRFSTLLLLSVCASAPARAASTPACGSPARACDPEFVAADAKIRATDPALADDYQKLYEELIALSPDSVKLEKDLPDVSASALAEFNRRRHALVDRGAKDGGPSILDHDGNPRQQTPLHSVDYYVGFSIYTLALKNVPEQYKKIGADLSALEDQARRLEDDVKAGGAGLSAQAKNPFEERLMKLNDDGTKVWDLLHADALNEADSDYSLNGGGQQLMNPLQARIAALSKRLQGIDRALNGDASRSVPQDVPKISDALRDRMKPDLQNLHPFGPDAGVPDDHPSGTALAAAIDGVGRGAYALSAVKKTLLDLSPVPPPAPGPGSAPPEIQTGAAGEDASPAATKAVEVLRRAGLAVTIGDVAQRAGYAFKQTGNTCAIGAQVEVLADLGEVKPDPKDLQAKASDLLAHAVTLRYFAGSAADPDRLEHGTNSWQHVGDLLDRPIQRLYQVSDADLFKIVSSGRMVIVTVDAGVLWHDRQYAGLKHVIVITGAEVNRATRRPLGYYVNDTGTGEGGRFVDAGQFLHSWDRTVVAPQ